MARIADVNIEEAERYVKSRRFPTTQIVSFIKRKNAWRLSLLTA
jgi:hypothetical protein